MDYRSTTRAAYNNRRFDDLEENANEARSSKAKFGNGSWKIWQFYDCLGCSASEPESMWQLHGEIHKAWITAKPDSVTARLAQVVYLFDYAWHARGTGFANNVSAENWQVFGARLKVAREAWADCEKLGATIPYGTRLAMRIGLGRSGHVRTMTSSTLARRHLNRRSGTSIRRTQGIYPSSGTASPVIGKRQQKQRRLHRMVWGWRCTPVACWSSTPTTRMFSSKPKHMGEDATGFELMKQRYPGSVEITRAFCLLSCIGGDRATAKRLFEELGDNVWSDIWGTQDYLRSTKAWAGVTN